MGKRILVADDSLTIQRAFSMVLAGSEYELTFAKSVEEALNTVKRGPRPDLVLADIALGSGSGYDLCASLKSDSSFRFIPVHILASSQTPYDDSLGRKSGADGALLKPFDSQTIMDSLSMAIATGVTPPPAAIPGPSVDLDNTTRFSTAEGDVSPPFPPDPDEDDYGEIVIERGPAPTAPQPTPWSSRSPAPRVSTAMPVASTPAAPAAPVPSAPRPSLIPGAKPVATPSPRPSAPPIPTTPAGLAAQKQAMNRTIMGFPSVKPPVAQPASSSNAGGAAPPVSTTPGLYTPPAAVPTLSPPVARTTQAPPVLRQPPSIPAQPVVPQQSLSISQSAPTPTPPTAPAASKPAPIFAKTQAPEPLPSSAPGQSQVTRRVPTPVPSAVTAAISSAVDRKMSSLAARGPEYEAIAKLSRDIIEQVVWEVVPELAEVIIREEIDRLASAKK